MTPRWQQPPALKMLIYVQQKLLELRKKEIEERLARIKAQLKMR